MNGANNRAGASAHTEEPVVKNMDEDNEVFEEYDKDDSLLNKPEEEIIQMKISKKMRDLHDFLRANDFLTEKGDQKTNIINLAEKRCYNIPPSHIEEFFVLLDDCRKERRFLHFMERQETDSIAYSGIMIDFDRYQRSKEAQIKTDHFLRLIQRLTKIIKDTVDFASYADNNGKVVYRIFIIRKPAVVFAPVKNATGQPLYKDGFHILIPELQISKGLKIHILQEMNRRSTLKRIFNDIDNIEDPEKMLDQASARNPVHFFGNAKLDKPAYILTHVYEAAAYIDDDEDDNVKPLDLVEILASTITMNNIKIPINLTYELSLGFFLDSLGGFPTWLKKRKCECKAAIRTQIQLMAEKTDRGIFSENDLAADDNDIDMLTMTNAELKYLKELLAIIDMTYADTYEKWFKVICAIAHTGHTEAYKSLAKWFSKRCPMQWNPGAFEQKWVEAVNSRFAGRPVTKSSIVYWAKISSPQRFDEINSENYIRLLAKYAYENEGRIEHAMAAKILYYMAGNKFIVDVDPAEKNKRAYCWFEFVLPGQSMRKGEVFKWRREANPDNIHMFIAEQIPKVYREVDQKIKDRRDAATNEIEAKYYTQIEKTFKKFQTSLSNDGFQNGIIRQAEYKFRHRGFFEELDSYEDVLGVGNGVLIVGKTTTLVRGFHEYKISKYTETDYVPYDPENPYVKTLLAAFQDIFPEPDVCNFMLLHASTDLGGGETDGICVFLVGGGQNGKTFFLKMRQNSLGMMYMKPLRMALITAPSERAESANAALMDLKGLRGGYMDESGKVPIVNVERFKSIVNPGTQTSRNLYGKQEQFKITANLTALSNYQFIFETNDHGTWRRVYYYNCKVKFCANPDQNNPYEKQENRDFIYKYVNDPEYKQAMLSILTHYYEILCCQYGGDVTKVPVPTIMIETEKFRNKQDTINRFITQMIVKSPGADTILLLTIACKYDEWYRKNIKDARQSLDFIASQFENSRIMPFLERGDNGILRLPGHRIKNVPEESLQPGEEYLVKIVSPTASIYTPPQPNNFVREPVKVEPFIDNLTKNVPLNVVRDAPADNIDDINELLMSLT